MLVDQRLDRLVGVLSDGILKAANKLVVGDNMAELCKPTDNKSNLSRCTAILVPC